MDTFRTMDYYTNSYKHLRTQIGIYGPKIEFYGYRMQSLPSFGVLGLIPSANHL